MNKYFFICLMSIVLLGCAMGEKQEQQAEIYSQSGQCYKAEKEIKNEFPAGGYVYWWMGKIARDCRKDNKQAIEYFKLSHQAGTPWAAEELIKMGVSPPTRKVANQVTIQQQPQQVIIQQPQQISNPNACIQDGGAIFCPNHPNTQSTPSPYRPVFK